MEIKLLNWWHVLTQSQTWRGDRFIFTLFPEPGNLLSFGYELNPSTKYDERSFVSFSLFNLFSLYVYPNVGALLQRWTLMFRRFSFSLGRHDIYMSWGKTSFRDFCHEKSQCKIMQWPWHWTFVGQSYYSPDLKKCVEKLDLFLQHLDCPEPWRMQHPYVYEWSENRYENGEIIQHIERQETTATFYVTERVWKRRCLPFIKWRKRVIEVEFADEMGPKRGSWKGGVLGTSHEMRSGELPLDTLQRMMKERRFN